MPTINPRYSRETAYRLWKNGILSDSYYTINYMNEDERAAFRQWQRDELTRYKKMKEQFDKQMEEKILAKIDKAMDQILDGLKQ